MAQPVIRSPEKIALLLCSLDVQPNNIFNKPDYLLLSSEFCISTTKHVKCDNVRVAPVLNVSSTGCNNEFQSFAKLSYSAIDDVLTNLTYEQIEVDR